MRFWPKVTYDSLMKLQIIFPENLIIAALDLIDRGNGRPLDARKRKEPFNWYFFSLSVIRHITPWGHNEYEVLGSTATYTILIDLDAAPNIPYSCTCPSFIYAVLLSETHIMVRSHNLSSFWIIIFILPCPQCKHLLATFLARKLSLYIERPTDLNDFSTLYNLHFA